MTLISPIFFEDTVNTDWYAEILHDFVLHLPSDECSTYIQQDGTRTYTTAAMHELLGLFFSRIHIYRTNGKWTHLFV